MCLLHRSSPTSTLQAIDRFHSSPHLSLPILGCSDNLSSCAPCTRCHFVSLCFAVLLSKTEVLDSTVGLKSKMATNRPLEQVANTVSAPGVTRFTARLDRWTARTSTTLLRTTVHSLQRSIYFWNFLASFLTVVDHRYLKTARVHIWPATGPPVFIPSPLGNF